MNALWGGGGDGGGSGGVPMILVTSGDVLNPSSKLNMSWRGSGGNNMREESSDLVKPD